MKYFLGGFLDNIFKRDAIIDLRDLDTRYCVSLYDAFDRYSSVNPPYSSQGGCNIKILGIESFDVSNVTDFSNTFYSSSMITISSYRTLNLDLSNWDVRNGIYFQSFAMNFNILDISYFGNNTKLHYGSIFIDIGLTNTLIIEGPYCSISVKYDITNLLAPHDLLDKYKRANGSNITNYKPCEKLIKATIPEGYVISFNDSVAPEQDGISYIPYKTTKATYCMISPNYLPVTGEIDISSMARSEEKDITLEDTAKDTSGCTLTVNTTPNNATVKLTYKGATLTGNKIMVPANAKVNVKITCIDYVKINKTVTVTQKAQIDNNTMTVYVADHANFANNYTFTNLESTLLDNDNFAIDTTNKCLYSKKAYKVNRSISTGYIHIPSDLFSANKTLKVSVRTNAANQYGADTGVILVGNTNYTVTKTLSSRYVEGNIITLDSNTYTLLYNSYGKSESSFRTVSITLKANTEYYITFTYNNNSDNTNEDKMLIESIDIE